MDFNFVRVHLGEPIYSGTHGPRARDSYIDMCPYLSPVEKPLVNISKPFQTDAPLEVVSNGTSLVSYDHGKYIPSQNMGF